MAERALASAYVTIIPSMKGFNKTLTDELTSAGGKAGDDAGMRIGTGMKSGILGGMGGLTAAIGGMIAAVGIGSLIKDTISSASMLQDTVAAAGTVFGNEADRLGQWAEGASKAFGASKQQALDAALTFGTFGKAAGLTGAELSGFSMDLSQLAGDMASFRGTSTEQAIQAIGAALRGEAEPIRAYGVLLDDATLKSQAMEMGIYDGNGALTQQQKVLAAQASIFKQTSDAQGDYARTSDSAANTQKTFLTEIENLKAGIGTELLPVFTDLVKAFSDSLPALKEALIPAVKELAGGFKDALPQIIAVIGWFRDNISFIAQFAGAITAIAIAIKVATTVIGIINGIITIATAIQTGWNLAWLANPITWIILAIIVAIGLVIAAIWFLANNWEQVTAFFVQLWNNVVSFFTTTFAAIGQWFSDMWNGMMAGFQQFADWIGGILNTIGGFFASVWEGMVNGFRGAVNWIIGLFEGMINFIIDGINSFLKLLNGGLSAIKDVTGIDLKVGMLSKVSLPRLAKGGFVDQPTTALIGEAGPEVVTPLKDFERMMGLDNGSKQPSVTYNNYANPGLTSEQELLQAMKRGRIQGVV